SVFHTGGDLFYKAFAQIVVNVQFGIPGDLDHMGRDGLKIEHGEHIVKTVTDQNIQHHDKVSFPFRGKDHKAIDSLGDLDQGIAVVPGLPHPVLHDDLH